MREKWGVDGLISSAVGCRPADTGAGDDVSAHWATTTMAGRSTRSATI